MPDHNYFANLIWQIADLLRGPLSAAAIGARHVADDRVAQVRLRARPHEGSGAP
jgi:hypothetical protein